MTQAFYRKWRPHLWEEVVGQEHVVHTLQNAIRSGRVGHAYLFAGPRGTGKTTTARLLAKAVNCQAEDLQSRPCDHCAFCIAVNEGRFLDLIEIDAASNTSVDDVRDLREKINFRPTQGTYKVYIIDEVHMLSTAAFNALLKTLEEPPEHAIFILATTEVHKIPATVLSRCQRHEFRRIPVMEIVRYLQKIVKEENLLADDDALVMIARQATGSMRDAVSLLDQLASTGDRITIEVAQSVLGTAPSESAVELVNAIMDRNMALGLDCIHKALDMGTDPRQFARQVVDHLRNILLIASGNARQVDATRDMLARLSGQAERFDRGHLLEALRLFNNAATEKHSGWQPALLLELALGEAIQYHSVPAGEVADQTPVPVEVAVAQPHTAKSHHRPARQEPDPETEPALVEQAQSPTEESAPAVSIPADPAPAVAGGAVTLQVILQRWDDIKAIVKKTRPATQALLNSVKTVTYKDQVLVLSFASEVVRSKMDTADNLDITRQAIRQILQVDMPIQCVVATTRGGGLHADLDDPDGMVGTALDLGGQIVHRD